MPKIVRFHKVGSADVLKIENLPLTEPAAGEVRLQVEAIGLNRAEVMFRQGQYLEAPEFPSRIGYEASGTIDAVGPGVNGIQLGSSVKSLNSGEVPHGRLEGTVETPAGSVAMAFTRGLSGEYLA